MTFSCKVKDELCKIESSEKKAELYGLLLFSKYFKFSDLTFTTENKCTLNRVKDLILSQYKIIFDIVSPSHTKKGTFTLNVPFFQDRSVILKSMNYDEDEINLKIHKENLDSDERVRNFLRGVFLSCGTIVNPNISYHIEFHVPYMNLANDLSSVITEFSSLSIMPGIASRKGSFVVYVKGNENVVDFLTYIGASASAMEVIQVKMLKEVRNYINRTTNFETANLSKTTAAATIQIESIKKIQNSGLFELLDEDLKEVAKLRLENPDMSLKLLGENLLKPLTRSGVNHKIKKLLEIADKIK